MKLYGDDYLSVNNRIDLIHGMRLDVGAGFHQYTRLENVTNFSFFRNDSIYAPNTPVNKQLSDANLDSQRGFIIGASLSYTPRLRYRIYKGQKQMLDSKFPTFTLSYKRGVNSVFNSMSDFEQIAASAKQKIEWGVFSSFNWSVNGGCFTRNNQMHFSEFRHFNISEIPSVFQQSFMVRESLRTLPYSTGI